MAKLLDILTLRHKWNQEHQGIVALFGLKILTELVKVTTFWPEQRNETTVVTLKLKRFPLLVLCIQFEFIG